jgi:cellulose biosynthesis protein BcsQ
MRSNLSKVCFYSFKGGAGRTVCTANVAGTLAKELGAAPSNPALLLDLDLDSAGLTILLGKRDLFEGSKWSTDKLLTDGWALDIDPLREDFFTNHLVDASAELGVEAGTVRFVGGEVVGASDIAPPDGESLIRINDLIERSEERGIRALIIDSASGWQQTARLSHFVSDVVVYCCRLTHQFIEGTKLQLTRFVELCESESGHIPSIILLPVAVPPMNPNWEDRRTISLAALQGLCNTFKNRTSIEMAGRSIDEVTSFKWYESVLAVKPKLDADEATAKEAFASLAGQIKRMLGT